MRESRFTDAPILQALPEWAAGATGTDLVRPLGVTARTRYRWKQTYGGLQGHEAKRLKALEEDHRRLERLVACHALNLHDVKELLGETS